MAKSHDLALKSKNKNKMNNLNIVDQAGWRYYNTIKKKAMEREFSLSGLLISLSIAFFIVIGCACALNIIYSSL